MINMTIKELMNDGCAHQVMFYDGEGMCAGILFGDKIVCGCCGAIIEVEDVIDNATIDSVEEAIVLFNEWVNVSDEIRGGIDYHNYIGDGAEVVEVEGM